MIEPINLHVHVRTTISHKIRDAMLMHTQPFLVLSFIHSSMLPVAHVLPFQHLFSLPTIHPGGVVE
jgi:hypothetical protein